MPVYLRATSVFLTAPTYYSALMTPTIVKQHDWCGRAQRAFVWATLALRWRPAATGALTRTARFPPLPAPVLAAFAAFTDGLHALRQKKRAACAARITQVVPGSTSQPTTRNVLMTDVVPVNASGTRKTTPAPLPLVHTTTLPRAACRFAWITWAVLQYRTLRVYEPRRAATLPTPIYPPAHATDISVHSASMTVWPRQHFHTPRLLLRGFLPCLQFPPTYTAFLPEVNTPTHPTRCPACWLTTPASS